MQWALHGFCQRKQEKIEWLHQPPVSGHYEGPMEIDPFTVPLDKKVSLLLEADKVMATKPQLKHREHFCSFGKRKRSFSALKALM